MVGLKKKEDIQMHRIGKAAAKLFNEKGYFQTSIADIASAAKMSKGGIFHYFPTKNEILYFVLSNYVDVLLKDLEEDLRNVDDGFSRIQFIISRHIELYIKNIYEAKILLREGHNFPSKFDRIIAVKVRKYFEIVRSIISDVLGGSTSKDRSVIVTFVLFGMLNWTYAWYNPKGRVPPEELSKEIFRIFSKGLKGLSDSHKVKELRHQG